MKNPGTVGALLAALVVAAVGRGGDEGEESENGQASGTPIRTIAVDERDYSLEPSRVDVDRPGVYAFKVVNKGDVEHALEVEGDGTEVETDTLAPGESATLTVELKTGAYELYCPIGDHKGRGMEGEVSVGDTAGGATDSVPTTTDERSVPTTTTDSDDDSGGGYP